MPETRRGKLDSVTKKQKNYLGMQGFELINVSCRGTYTITTSESVQKEQRL